VDDAARVVSFGGLFGRSFGTFFSRAPQFLGIALVFGVPLYVVVALLLAMAEIDIAADPEHVDLTAGQGLVIVAIMFLVLMAYLLVMAGTVNAAIRHLRGFEVTVGESLRTAVARLGPVLLVSLLLYAISIGVFVAMVLLAMIPLVGFAFVVAGAVSLAYLYLRWWVVIPTVVVESPGVVASLRRSAFLTKGHRWLILGFMIVFGLVVTVGVGVLSAVVTLPFALTGLEIVGNVLGTVVGLAAYSLFSIAAAVAYHDLRVEKDGVDGDRLATVFD